MSGSGTVGEIRPSQLLHTFGIGSVVDLPHMSVMVMGLDDWNRDHCRPVVEDRLLAEVRRRLGADVKAMLAPPMAPEEVGGGFFKNADDDGIGVPVAPFPRWMRCPQCDLLAPLRSGLFQLRTKPNRPDQARYVHVNCNRANQPPVLPARFLLSCARGHLDDFPWRWFVHRGLPDCKGQLHLYERGLGGEAGDITVKCTECGLSRSMAEAFGEHAVVPQCRGRRPHLRDFEEKPCDEEDVRAILLGATNSWFPVTLRLLYVPPDAADDLQRKVEQHWEQLELAVHKSIVGFLRKQGALGDLTKYSDDEIWGEIERRRDAGDEEEEEARDLLLPEWRVFSKPDPSRNGKDFETEEVDPPELWKGAISRVVVLKRLRAVQALLGFTRIRSPRDFDENTPLRFRAPLSRGAPSFVPAGDVRGEGIFLQFPEGAIAKWCAGQSNLEKQFLAAHVAWRTKCGIEPPDDGFPGIRYVLLHSLAHALMREFALECGYTAASLSERIYARDRDGDEEPMAGILIYTAAQDSEGTLGGLARLGEPKELGRHLERALAKLRVCSSDPLCADHEPEAGGPAIHGAACHACLFAPETSCERGNRFLDRTVLVETVRGAGSPFFRGNQ